MRWRTGNPSKLLGAGFRRVVDPQAMANYREIHHKAREPRGARHVSRDDS